MDEHTFRVLEFDKVLEMVAAFAVTAPGRAVVQKIRPLNNLGDIRQQIDSVSECRRLLSRGQLLGIEYFDDLTSLFQRIRPADAVLEPFELRSFLPLFHSALNLKILSHSPSYTGLGTIASQLITHPDIKKTFEEALDWEGNIRDRASPELFRIRRSIKSCGDKIRGILEGILKNKELIPHLQDFYLAERNKRWVIPVKRDSKGSVPGIVHDISNTGETVYVEPYAIQPLGNELESFRAEEKLEEFRVLQRLSTNLRGHLHEIEKDYRIIADVDALQAIAGFSEQMNMYPPEINERGHLNIIKGRHPLLWKTLNKVNREERLVPLDLEIGRGKNCMIITGSNAGGKTVTLKTTGIISLMALSGMHTPSESGTTVPFLERILADIGDEQSIEHNLSTFSAHITRISEIIGQSGAHALILIDELGTGTDPEQGGALSCAILRRLKQKGAIALVSTHLGILKAFAHTEQGMINSAMEMEEISIHGKTTYRPTYKLNVGQPGTSHAFEIAESLGLHGDIIREAREFMAAGGSQVDALIAEFREKAGKLGIRLKEAEHLKQEVARLRSNVKEELSRLKSLKQNALVNALNEAEEIIRKTKREATDIIQRLKQKHPTETGTVVKNLNRKLKELDKMRKLHIPEKIEHLKDVREGQRVFVSNLGTHGVVCSVNKKTKRCKVMVGDKEIVVPLTALSEPVADLLERDKSTVRRTPARTIEFDEVPRELNVIGKRVDPSLSRIERYLNDASLAGLKQVKIIHGIGTGTLSRSIREYLKDHPLVERAEKGAEDEGGEGVTVVFL